MKSSSRLALGSLIALAAIATGAANAVADGQRIDVQIISDSSDPPIHSYRPGASKYSVPQSLKDQAERGGKPAPTLAVKTGDVLILHNTGATYARPFSLSIGNKFNIGKPGLSPGGSKSIVVSNVTDKPILFRLSDEVRNRTIPLWIAVLPTKEVKDTLEASFTGTWKTTFGTMTLTQTGDSIGGKYDYKGGSSIENGKIEEDGYMHFEWSEPAVNDSPGRHGIGKFKLDSNSFEGKWNYILSDGTSIGRGGIWNGTRIK